MAICNIYYFQVNNKNRTTLKFGNDINNAKQYSDLNDLVVDSKEETLDADVKIIQDEKVVSYGACGMPYVIEGIVKDFQELIERPPDVFKKEYCIDVITNTRARK